MSRIGKVPISVPKEVKVAIENNVVKLQGPKGNLSLDIPLKIKVEHKDENIEVTRSSDDKQSRSNHGTIRSRLNQMVIGVTQGHKKELAIEGVGFRAQVKGTNLEVNLGFSHPVVYALPKDVKVSAPKPTELVVEGADKVAVGQIAAELRGLKPPEPYKGKGIKYVNEVIRRKQGKSISK